MRENVGTDINVGRRDFEADRRICDAATKGPWKVKRQQRGYQILTCEKIRTRTSERFAEVQGFKPKVSRRHYLVARVQELERAYLPEFLDSVATDEVDDAAFIAAARDGWPAALDEIERLRTENEKLRQEVYRRVPVFDERAFERD